MDSSRCTFKRLGEGSYEVWSRDGGMLLGSVELWTDEWLIEGDPDEVGYATRDAAARALVKHWRDLHGEVAP